jgi:hypothetical protein
MEQNKINKIIIEVVFGILLIVPIVIGLSIYSRPEPPQHLDPQILPRQNPMPISYPTPLPTSVVLPPVQPTPVNQSRHYVVGYPYDSSTGKMITNMNLATNFGSSYIQSGYFSVAVNGSSTKLSLIIEGYKATTIEIGPDNGSYGFTQNLGNIAFEPEPASLAVNLYKKIDPADNKTKLYYKDKESNAEIKVVDQNILDFKQSPDLKKVAYIFSDDTSDMVGANIIVISKPNAIFGSFYSEHKPDFKITIIDWSQNSCCVAWVSHNVKTQIWGDFLEYVNIDTQLQANILNPISGAYNFEKIGKVVFSPDSKRIAAEYFVTGSDNVLYNGFLLRNINEYFSNIVQQSNQTSFLKEFFFDSEDRLNWLVYHPNSEKAYEWMSRNLSSNTTQTFYSKPSFWKE